MSAKKNSFKPEIDSTKVKVDSEESIKYWCDRFNCQKENLIKTVIKVGDSVISVDAYLEMNHYKTNV